MGFANGFAVLARPGRFQKHERDQHHDTHEQQQEGQLWPARPLELGHHVVALSEVSGLFLDSATRSPMAVARDDGGKAQPEHGAR